MQNQFLLLSFLFLSWGGRTFFTSAFAPAPLVGSKHPSSPTTLEATRRDVMGVLLLGSGVAFFQPYEATAFSQQLDDYAFEPQQQATDGKFDLNSAFVVSPPCMGVFGRH